MNSSSLRNRKKRTKKPKPPPLMCALLNAREYMAFERRDDGNFDSYNVRPIEKTTRLVGGRSALRESVFEYIGVVTRESMNTLLGGAK